MRSLSLTVTVVSIMAAFAYSTYAVFFLPDPGFDYRVTQNGWQVTGLHCTAGDDIYTGDLACINNAHYLREGDLIIEYGGEKFYDLNSVTGSYSADGVVAVSLLRDGETVKVLLSMGKPRPLLIRYFGFAAAMPFLMVSVFLLYVFGKRIENREGMAIIYMSVFGLWISLFSLNLVDQGDATFRVLSWVLWPLSVHFVSLLSKRKRPISSNWILAAYGVSMIGAMWNNGAAIPFHFATLFILLFVGYRFDWGTSYRILFVGACMTLLPTLIWMLGNAFVRSPTLSGLSFLSIPIWPLFVVYSLARRDLGSLEPGISKVMTYSAFLSLFINGVSGLVIIGILLQIAPAQGAINSIYLAAIGIIAMFPLISSFEAFMSSLQYGRVYSVDELVGSFVQKLGGGASTSEIGPATAAVLSEFGVSKLALYIRNGQGFNLIHDYGNGQVPPSQLPRAGETPAWVRVPLTLKVQMRVVGLLLLGDKRHDDFYPQHEIAHLEMLAAQLATILEIGRLNDTLLAELREKDNYHRAAVQSAKMAAMGRLVASISHELKNPLATVQGFLLSMHMFGQDEFDKQKKSAIAQAEHMIDLINAIRKPIAPDESDKTAVGDALTETLMLANQRILSANVEVVTDVKDVTAWITKGELIQILSNLVLNACDAISAKGDHGVIQINVHETAVGPMVSITDDGIGIPESRLQNVFDPFTSTKSDGDGLGLFIAYSIVERRGGSISVQSQPMHGTSFEVQLLKEPPEGFLLVAHNSTPSAFSF